MTLIDKAKLKFGNVYRYDPSQFEHAPKKHNPRDVVFSLRNATFYTSNGQGGNLIYETRIRPGGGVDYLVRNTNELSEGAFCDSKVYRSTLGAHLPDRFVATGADADRLKLQLLGKMDRNNYYEAKARNDHLRQSLTPADLTGKPGKKLAASLSAHEARFKDAIVDKRLGFNSIAHRLIKKLEPTLYTKDVSDRDNS